MSIIIPANSAVGGGFDVANSARFNKGSSDSLTRTQSASPTSATKGTLSFWIKRSLLDVSQYYMSTFQDSNNRVQSWFQADNTFKIIQKVSASTTIEIITNRVFRDISAWYHVVLAFDTDQGTSSNRVKIYINGVQETSFSTATYPAQGQDSFLTKGTSASLGAYNGSGDYTSAYFSEIVLIDGQQLTPTSFGEFDSDSGSWKAIDVSGLTFGTNGYYLDFEDSSALGNDAAGSNNFTANNLSAVDQTTDTCTNNFCNVNSLDNFYEDSTFSDGNCKIVTEASLYSYNTSTIGLTQGKWYCEVFIETSPHPSTKDSMIGIAGRMSEGNDNFLGQSSDTYGIYGGSGQIFNNGSPTSYGVSQTTNDIVGIYMDLDNNKLYFAKNGSLMNSGTGFNLLASNLTTAGAYFMVAADYGGGYQGTYRLNFGNPIYALSSANTDVNGYGSFEYDPSSGTFDGASKDFLAICTKNLSEALS
jgi:hypothetical protein